MPDIAYLATLAIVIFVNALIFWMIIRSAVASGTETPKRMKHVWAQTELLIAMARKQGVDESALKAITDHLK